MGFVPPGAQGIERGKGFVAYEKNGVEFIKFTSRAGLQKEIARAIRYAGKNGGDLPATAFWDKTADVYDNDVKLFKKQHQCRPLLALLRRDELHDQNNPPVPTPLPPPPLGDGPLTPSQPLPFQQDPVFVTPGAVPEPASVLSLCFGLLFIFVVARSRVFTRLAPAT